MRTTTKSLLIGLLAILVAAGSAGASTQLVSEGRALLFNRTYSGIVAADAKFAQAVSATPDDSEANLFRAVSRTLAFALEKGSGGPATLADFFTALGMTRTGQDSIDLGPPYTNPGSEIGGAFLLPSTTPSGEDLRAFMAGPLLTLVSDDLANLAKITDTSFSTNLTPQETGDLFPIEVDYGDVLIARSFLYSLQGLCNLIAADAIPADFQEINRLINADVFQLQRDLLDRYSTLFTLRSDAAPTLVAARQALINAIDSGDAAFTFIASETDDQSNDLFAIGSPEDQADLAKQLFFLKEGRDSLTQNRTADFSTSMENWQLTIDNQDSASLRLELDKNGTYVHGEMYSMSDQSFFTSWQQSGSQIHARLSEDHGSCVDTVTIDATMSSETSMSGTYSAAGCETANGTISGRRQSVESNPRPMDFRPLFDTSLALRDLLPQFVENNEPKDGSLNVTAWQKLFPAITSQDALEQFLEPGYFRILPQAAIAIDGDASDWQNVPVLVNDGDDPGDPLPSGGDIKSLRVATDGTYLYWLMDFNDPPVGDSVTVDLYISAEVFGSDMNPDGLSITVTKDSTNGDQYNIAQWSDGSPVATSVQDFKIGSVIEARIPLSAFPANTVSFYFSGGSYSPNYTNYDWLSGETDSVHLPTTSVSGTLTCPDCGSGTIYVYARTEANPFSVMAGNAVLTGPGSFTITGLPANTPVYLLGFWDQDNNGIPSFGDIVGVNTQSYAGSTTDATLNLGTPAENAMVLTKPGGYLLYGSNDSNLPPPFMASSDPTRIFWGYSWTYLGAGTSTREFTASGYFKYLLLTWPGDRIFQFDALEDLTAGTAFGLNADGSFPAYSWWTSNLYPSTAPSASLNDFIGHADGKFVVNGLGGPGYALMQMPEDTYGSGPRTLRVTVAFAGDFNLDGKADLADAITGMRLLTAQPSDFKVGSMDINGDGKFGQAEVLFLLRYLAGGGQ